MGVLKIEDLNRGMVLKQGDETQLKFRLYDADGDELNIKGKSVEVVLKIGYSVYHSQMETVTQTDTVEFSLMTILPPGSYYLEFVTSDNQIFPSEDRDKFKITSSSKGEDITYIEVNGVEKVAQKALDLISDEIDSEISKIPDNEANRQNTFTQSQLSRAEAFDTTQTQRQTDYEAKETQRQEDFMFAEAERNTAEATRESNELGRITNEETRKQAEQARETAEGQRQADFIAAENNRATAESNRDEAETLRQTAEQQREANEGDRVQAEIEREIIFEAQKKPLIMGVEWGRTADPTMTRIGASKDLVANIGIADEVVRNDFDTMPIYREMQRETDKYGNVFVRIPKFYIRKTVTDTLCRVEISTEKLKGFYLPAIFYDFEKDKELEYSLIGAYLASDSADGTKSESKPGVKPLVSRNIVQFRDYAMANGEGYQQLDIHAADVLQTLFRVEFATLNSQAVHPGFTSGNTESALTGGTDELIATSGAMGTSGNNQFVYRGIEDPWGNLYQFVDGVNINDHQAWVCKDARQYASNVFASPYEKLGYVNATGNTWVTEMGYDPNHPFAEFPVTGGGSATTYYADHYYQNAGQRIARFGGSWSSGSPAGLSFWALSVSSAYAHSDIGGRLLKLPL